MSESVGLLVRLLICFSLSTIPPDYFSAWWIAFLFFSMSMFACRSVYRCLFVYFSVCLSLSLLRKKRCKVVYSTAFLLLGSSLHRALDPGNMPKTNFCRGQRSLLS